MPQKKHRDPRILGLLILIAVGVIAGLVKPTGLAFKQDVMKHIPTMFGYLLLISLFVERAIEVILSAWRSREADQRDLAIAHMETDMEATPPPGAAKAKDLRAQLKTLEMERCEFRADSRHISQWLGMVIGVLVAFVGVRVLEDILDTNGLAGWQATVLILVDIGLTGIFLAGGSEAINKIMKVYNGFMTATANKADKLGSPKPTDTP